MDRRVIIWTDAEESKFFAKLFDICVSRQLFPLKKFQRGLFDACMDVNNQIFDPARKKTKWYFVQNSEKYRDQLNMCYEKLHSNVSQKPTVTIKPSKRKLIDLEIKSQEKPSSPLVPSFKPSPFVFTFKNQYGGFSQPQPSNNDEIVKLRKELHDATDMLQLISNELVSLTQQLSKVSQGIVSFTAKSNEKPTLKVIDRRIAILGTLPFPLDDVKNNLEKMGISFRTLKVLRPNFSTKDVENHEVIVFTRIVGHSIEERARIGQPDRSKIHYVNGGMKDLVNKLVELASR